MYVGFVLALLGFGSPGSSVLFQPLEIRTYGSESECQRRAAADSAATVAKWQERMRGHWGNEAGVVGVGHACVDQASAGLFQAKFERTR